MEYKLGATFYGRPYMYFLLHDREQIIYYR